ncbi:radical SAM family heme chaperone HemW [Terrimonas ferruginea]|uniref:radical SAM family heme chaperone HemW n=1 Tax=Terrimonas ferruginea TaxID=249 RepID=UPI00040DDE76|nr:radical SAM family heme chaperone HemW [Terrimonas ferruginea]
MAGIYLHIPFCKQACHYCNFHFSTSLHYKPELVAALQEEARLAAEQFPFPPGEAVHTIYFGGGTPSLLTLAELTQLLTAVRGHFNVDPDAEITLEVNPDDISEERLKEWRDAGINRLSIGVQSFFEEELRWMNRAHTAKQALEQVKKAREYFNNITIDLIYGGPGLSDEQWHQDLEQAKALNIPHLSCYALTVEPQTPLNKMIRAGKVPDVDPDKQSRHFLYLMQWAKENGYEHYEISNFARPGYRSRHNSAYWQGKSYIGLGPSAHSFDGKSRWWNIANNQAYIRSLQEGLIPFEKEELTGVQQLNERIMIALRTADGLDLSHIPSLEKTQLLKAAQRHIDAGHLVAQENKLRLTDEGRLLADGIAADLFFEEIK